jgi:uncharacterized protein (TIGR02271 family)
MAGTGMTGTTARGQEHANVQLSEEQLKVGKREVEAGGVRLRKTVRTETVHQPVQLRREEVVVERVPAGEATRRGTASFEQQEVYVPLRREEPVIEKEARVCEEVGCARNPRASSRTYPARSAGKMLRSNEKVMRRKPAAREGGHSAGVKQSENERGDAGRRPLVVYQSKCQQKPALRIA